MNFGATNVSGWGLIIGIITSDGAISGNGFAAHYMNGAQATISPVKRVTSIFPNSAIVF